MAEGDEGVAGISSAPEETGDSSAGCGTVSSRTAGAVEVSSTDWDAESMPERAGVSPADRAAGSSTFRTLITSLMEGIVLMGFMPGLKNVLLEILGFSEMASL